VLNDIILVGRVTDHNTEAGNLVTTLRQRIDNTLNIVMAASSMPKVYHEINIEPYMSVGKGTYVDELIKLAGGQNIFENATDSYPLVSSEALFDQNPDVMFFPLGMPGAGGTQRFWGSFEEVQTRPAWDSINAVRNDKLYEVENGIIVSRPGPRLIDGLEAIARIIHPELFR
jgi:iron complex transport system substrate-binding protein